MKLSALPFYIMFLSYSAVAQQFNDTTPPRVTIANGVLEGTNVSGIRSFKGVPYAAPPVGTLRWKAPQPVPNWTGVKKADHFGPRAMQLPLFGDMNFRSDGMSEDCLYLNIWTPAKTGKERLPVLVYFFGGGFVAGDGSEPRYDGESMSRQGIVAITINYRLTVFGFLAHPELTKESPNHASGNYGLLDQYAALEWVKENIAAFGGDPAKVTIAGESAGSFAVSAQMASPLAKNLIAGAIGESGSLLSLNPPVSLQAAEAEGVKFAAAAEANSLAELRAMPADKILGVTKKPGFGRFPVTIDGYFLPKSPAAIYAAGEQAHVPLLVGWNSAEGSYSSIIGKDEPTVANYKAAVEKRFGNKAADILKVYQPANDEEVKSVGTDLASDQFIGYGTWKWSDIQSRTGGKPVFRYLYARPRPQMRPEMGNAVAGLAGGVIRDSAATPAAKAPAATGAVHSAEIEYAMGNLPTNRVYDWQPEDFEVSGIMQAFFANFIKTGNPNGLGVPHWPAVDNSKPVGVMYIDVNTGVVQEKTRNRYLALEQLAAQ